MTFYHRDELTYEIGLSNVQVAAIYFTAGFTEMLEVEFFIRWPTGITTTMVFASPELLTIEECADNIREYYENSR